MIGTLHGLRVIVNPLIVEVKIQHDLVQNVKRRRKRWSVQRIKSERPGCYQIGDTLVMHTDIYNAIPKEPQHG